MLVFNPFYIFSASFQLSGLATLGLILSPSLKLPNLSKFVEETINTFLLTCSTFLFTLPVIVNLSGFSSPFAIVSNILILPFVTLITIVNILGLIPYLGSIFFVLDSIMESLLLFFIHDFASFVPRVGLASFSPVEIGIYYVVLILATEVIRGRLGKSSDKINLS
jgi:competence protein ComEC